MVPRTSVQRFPVLALPPAPPPAVMAPPAEAAPPVARRSVIRQAGVIFGIAVLAWAVYEGIPSVWNKAWAMRYQQQCWDYTPPDGELGGRPAPPACWTNYVKAMHGKRASRDRILFLHGLRSPGGTERLVGVFRASGPWSFIYHYPNDPPWATFTRATWGSEPTVGRGQEVWPETTELVAGNRPQGGRPPDPIDETPFETFSPGRVDPADPSHFSLKYHVEGWEVRRSGRALWCGGEGVLDGWLQDDGTVRMQFTRTARFPQPAE